MADCLIRTNQIKNVAVCDCQSVSHTSSTGYRRQTAGSSTGTQVWHPFPSSTTWLNRSNSIPIHLWGWTQLKINQLHKKPVRQLFRQGVVSNLTQPHNFPKYPFFAKNYVCGYIPFYRNPAKAHPKETKTTTTTTTTSLNQFRA